MISGNNSETRPAVAADELAGQILLLDTLHSAAAEGRLQQLCPLPEDALKSWMAEIQYLAGETLAEIERHAVRRTAPQLRLLPKDRGRRSRTAI